MPHIATMEDRLAAFIASVREALLYAVPPDPETRRAVTVLLRKLPRNPVINSPPLSGRNGACRYLEQAMHEGESHPPTLNKIANVVSAFRALEPDCAWMQNPNYNARNQGPSFRAGQTYAQPMGPGGMMQSNELSLNVMLMSPGILYKEHAHQAPELYFILSGESYWRRSGEPWRRRGAGELILHTPNQTHTTQTDTHPLLCLAMWYADVTSHAQVV